MKQPLRQVKIMLSYSCASTTISSSVIQNLIPQNSPPIVLKEGCIVRVARQKVGVSNQAPEVILLAPNALSPKNVPLTLISFLSFPRPPSTKFRLRSAAIFVLDLYQVIPMIYVFNTKYQQLEIKLILQCLLSQLMLTPVLQMRNKKTYFTQLNTSPKLMLSARMQMNVLDQQNKIVNKTYTFIIVD